jgi:hypothetical protein
VLRSIERVLVISPKGSIKIIIEKLITKFSNYAKPTFYEKAFKYGLALIDRS